MEIERLNELVKPGAGGTLDADSEGYKYFKYVLCNPELVSTANVSIIYRSKDITTAVSAVIEDLDLLSYNNRVEQDPLFPNNELPVGFKLMIMLLNRVNTTITQNHTSELMIDLIGAKLEQILPVMAPKYITGDRTNSPHMETGEFRLVELVDTAIKDENFGSRYISCDRCGAIDTEDGGIHGNTQKPEHWE